MQRAAFSNPLVMVVDDESEMRRLIARYIEGDGYDIIEAADGLQALELFEECQPDLILLDAMMPQLDGFQTCQRLQSLPGGADTPVLMVTALNDRESIRKAFEAGAIDYIPKPVNWPVLVQRVKKLIEIRQGRRDLERSELRFRQLFEAAPQGILLIRSTGEVMLANVFIESLFGYAETEVVGRHIGLLIPEIEFKTDWLDGDGCGGKKSPCEMIGLHKRQYGIPVEITRGFLDLENESLQLIFINDISPRTQVEELRKAKAAAESERALADKLLYNVLPAPIADRLKKQNHVIADGFDDVSILFADIVNFSSLSAKIPPYEVVSLLNEIFLVFDNMVQIFNLEKIKTIGDEYMVVGNLPLQRKDHLSDIVEMALNLQEVIKRFQFSSGDALQLRIGISLGAVVAGVIGRNKLSYDIWGTAVNLAKRMESTAPIGEIQVTPEIYERLRLRYAFKAREPFEVKGFGEMQPYLLIGRK